MKKKMWKAVVTGVSLLLTGVIVSSVVMNSILEAEAADTLLGIQQLIADVEAEYKENEKKYTILEVVPDRSAAEIGYLFDEFEPALSVWDDTEMRWIGWKEQLTMLDSFAERYALVEGLKNELKAYHDELNAKGITKYPVDYVDALYEESAVPADGYERIEIKDAEKAGYFNWLGFDAETEEPGEGGEEPAVTPENREEATATPENGEEEPIATPENEEEAMASPDNSEEDIESDRYMLAFNSLINVPGSDTEGKAYKAIDNQVLQIAMESAEDNDRLISVDELGYDWPIYQYNGGSMTYEFVGFWSEVREQVLEDLAKLATPTPTETPTETPSATPSETPSATPSETSSATPSGIPSAAPSETSSATPSGIPSVTPSETPSVTPSETPSAESNATEAPTADSGEVPSASEQPTIVPGELSETTDEAVQTTADGHHFVLFAEIDPSATPGETEVPEETEEPAETPADDEEVEEPAETPTDGEGAEEPTETPTDEEGAEEPTETPTDVRGDVDGGSGSDLELIVGAYYIVPFEKIDDISMIPDVKDIYLIDEEKIVKSDAGHYEFIEDENFGKYIIGQDAIYCKNTFINNEWFRKHVLNMGEEEYESFPVEVITMTPNELDAANANSAFPDFDFLYINSGKTAGEALESEGGTGEEPTPVPGEGEGTTVAGVTDGITYSADIDLSEPVAQILWGTVCGGALPCLVDGNIIYTQSVQEDDPAGAGEEESATTNTIVRQNEAMADTNIFKLCVMFCQDPLPGTGFADGDVATLWTTLAEPNGDGNYATDHVYCHTGYWSIINHDFWEDTLYDGNAENAEISPGFQKVLDEIKLENLYREADTSGDYKQLSTDVSQAVTVRHIMNYQNRRNVEPKSTISVLEIHPALADEPDLTLEQIQKWAPDVEKVNTTIMTTAEFIGKIDTLNDKYDLIYLGTSLDHMNINAQRNTVFNDPAMQGLIYYNIGDLRVGNMMLSGLLNTEYKDGDRSEWTYHYNFVRYGGNDITEEKKNALLAFLDGSYPIVVSDDFFEPAVRMYQDVDYKGYSVALKGEGVYYQADLEALGAENDDVTSFEIKEGYQLTAYDEGESLNGLMNTWTQDVNWIGPEFNDKISSVVIKKIGDSVRTIDEYTIDNCTYMYEFLNEALEREYTNFYAVSDLTKGSELFQFYLNRPKADVVNFSANGDREYSDQNDVYYVQPLNNKYYLEYSFAIENKGTASRDTRYKCNLYIDVNADGKFSESEAVEDFTITNGGNVIDANNLYADNQYELTREVMDEFKGVLPWKVEVCQVNNDNIYASETGFTKLLGLQAETIKVCQITRNSNDVLNLAVEFDSENSAFNTLIKTIDDEFDIDVTCLTVDQFEEAYAADPNYLTTNEFNMLILGFSDLYDDFEGDNTKGPMSAIVSFINSGKSVLFAHDTTSFVNYPVKDGAERGYLSRTNDDEATTRTTAKRFATGLNTYVRPLVGMDRYGIQLSSASDLLKEGRALTGAELEKVQATGKDVAYKHRSGRTETVPEVHGFTYIVINGWDKKFNLDNGRNTDDVINTYNQEYLFANNAEAIEKLGRTGDFTNTYRNIRYDKVYPNYNGYPKEDDNSHGELTDESSGAVGKLSVSQVNKGQITEYPFKIQENFIVATTHGQYYELDYTADDDEDGQSDLVVWYCLSKRDIESPDGGHWDTVYSQSPNDVRNNYYIYNKGNITYTGMGHSAGKENYTFEEAKLFINTMIASYSAGIKAPIVAVKESGLPDSATIQVLYRYFDDAIDTNGDGVGDDYALTDQISVGDYEKVYFTVRDINLVKGTRTISTRVYYDVPAGTEGAVNKKMDDEDKLVKELPVAGQMFNAATNEATDPDSLVSGTVYYVNVPKSVLSGGSEDSFKLYFETWSTLTNNRGTGITATVYTTDKAYTSLDVMKIYLFDLN